MKKQKEQQKVPEKKEYQSHNVYDIPEPWRTIFIEEMEKEKNLLYKKELVKNDRRQ
jgi:hypothetical protein